MNAPSKAPGSVLAELMAVIEDRQKNPPAKSYTTTLLQAGTAKIGGKVLEEAAEIVGASFEPGAEGREHVVKEAADVLYHLFVLMVHRQVTLAEVEAELARRFGISGLDEKAARNRPD
jgi:phosphoribosyl-ATP pyrophosphohydrolase